MSGADRAIRWSTALAVLGVAVVAAVVSYQHSYEVVRAHGESDPTAHLVPLTVDGLIYASSMVLLHSARRDLPPPALARWLLSVGITATLCANIAHGWAHGPVGAAVAAWPAAEDADQRDPVDEPTRAAVNRPGPEPDQVAAAGAPLSERKLAAQFGRSRRWARRIIAAVRENTDAAGGPSGGELIAIAARE